MLQRITELRQSLHNYNYAYYVLNQPLVSDQQYDAMYTKLLSLETDYPEYFDPNSPTQRIGSDLRQKNPRYPHPIPMQSIQSIYTVNKASYILNNISGPFIVMPKFDGIAIELHYKNGDLVRALTRGNGTEGNDITANARCIKSIPLKINITDSIIVRGEVYITNTQMQNLNKHRRRIRLEEYQNNRSAAAALLTANKTQTTAQAGLSSVFFFMAIQGGSGYNIPDLVSQLYSLISAKFPVPKYTQCETHTEALSVAMQTAKGIDNIPTDGAVVRSVTSSDQPATSRNQPGAIALKPYSQVWETTLLLVSYSISNNGKITPVAHFTPFEANGSTYSKASLHTVDNMHALNLVEHSQICVQITGGIIPEVISCQSTGNPVRAPQNCPHCGQQLTAGKCLNKTWCPSQGSTITEVLKHVQYNIKVEFNHTWFGPDGMREICRWFNAMYVPGTEKNLHYILAQSLSQLACIATRYGQALPGPHEFQVKEQRTETVKPQTFFSRFTI